MTKTNYQRENLVSAKAEEAYAALTTGFQYWWTPASQIIEKVNDEITFRFPPNPTYWTMRVEKLVPNKTVVLKCIDANHVHDGLPESIRHEWKDTELKWEIIQKDGMTLIKFEHKGLTPTLGCYDICEAGWDYFFVDSLKKYLENNEGNPGHSENNLPL